MGDEANLDFLFSFPLPVEITKRSLVEISGERSATRIEEFPTLEDGSPCPSFPNETILSDMTVSLKEWYNPLPPIICTIEDKGGTSDILDTSPEEVIFPLDHIPSFRLSSLKI